ncbi:MAG: molybdopterin molybdotransferase MoeA [Phycisphaerales bacterium]|nr:molybdopterin molybdotransferase MoeA [Phycisphaerales bacterium]
MVTSPADAVCAMVERCSRVGVEEVELGAALGRVLAAPAKADRPSPAADLSAMDGFACRIEEARSGPLPIRGEVRIGSRPAGLEPGCAARIVTGAAIPERADTVIRIEDAQVEGEIFRLSGRALVEVRIGANIRRRGENLEPGAEFVACGREITPAVSVALATFGVGRPVVFRRVRVAVISTGDEVIGIEDTPTPWQVRDGNGPGLRALLGCRPMFECVMNAHIGDDPGHIRAGIERAIACADTVLMSGGVSMGHRDFVPNCLRGMGAEVLFQKIPQRPGRPVLGAVMPSGQPVFGLPGNPLSVLVTARRIAIPVLAHRAGVTTPTRPMGIVLEADDLPGIPLWWHRLVRLSNLAGQSPGAHGAVAIPVDGRSSGDVVAACRSDGFVEVPPGLSGPGPWPFYPWVW